MKKFTFLLMVLMLSACSKHEASETNVKADRADYLEAYYTAEEEKYERYLDSMQG